MDVPAEDVFKKLNQIFLLDVRQPEEFTGPLSHIDGAELIVLDELPDRVAEIPRDKPVVVICKSGVRSARACGFLKSEGFKFVWNMAGGMMRWNELKLPVAT